jgi:hypothetical protein
MVEIRVYIVNTNSIHTFTSQLHPRSFQRPYTHLTAASTQHLASRQCHHSRDHYQSLDGNRSFHLVDMRLQEAETYCL